MENPRYQLLLEKWTTAAGPRYVFAYRNGRKEERSKDDSSLILIDIDSYSKNPVLGRNREAGALPSVVTKFAALLSEVQQDVRISARCKFRAYHHFADVPIRLWGIKIYFPYAYSTWQ
jgi:hypothetical protein